ncbi:MAG: zf-HC2 domain-containing protein [Pseudomonadota bacterium]|nr:zf-HC2 domain-containing protein [Pseudomonadota bacterium]
MKARILPLGGAEHRITQELLPWFLNGTLDAAESAQVTSHLDHCPRCQADAAAHAEVRALSGIAEPEGSVDRGWSSLRARLDGASATPRHPLAARSRPWWRSGLQVVVALQAAVMLVLAIGLIELSSRGEPYRALGAVPTATEANVLAVFRADATEQQMRDALRAAGGRIVGGPTASDAYLLRLNDLTPAALARLRAQPGVLKIESLQGEAGR